MRTPREVRNFASQKFRLKPDPESKYFDNAKQE